MASQPLIQTKLDSIEHLFEQDLNYSESEAKFKELQDILQQKKLEYFQWLDFDYLEKINHKSKTLATTIKKQGMRNALVIGMGGSGINSLVLQNALQEYSPSHKNVQGQSLKLIVQNNLDPSSLKSKLLKLDISGELNKTIFVVISKSGSTDEVTRNVNTIINYLARSLGKAVSHDQSEVLTEFGSRLVIITEPKDNFLTKLKSEIENKTGLKDIASLENHPQIGGRFSMFSPVAMFSAELMGLSSDELIAGAKTCWEDFLGASTIRDSIVAKLAFIDIMLVRKHAFAYRYSMVYADALEALNKFRAQLKGESLNKTGIDSTVHIAGIGTVNHHSDLELLFKANNRLLLEQVYFGKPSLDHINQATGLEAFSRIENESNHESLISNHIQALAKYLSTNHYPVIQTCISEQKEKALAYYLMQDMLVTVVQAGLQDTLGDFSKLDLAVRQWEVEKYKAALRA